MKNYLSNGDTLTIPAPAAVSSGGVVIAAGIKGVAATDAASGADVAVVTRGLFTLPKAAANAITLGASVYWDATPGEVTTTSTDNTLLGVAAAAAGTSDTTVDVKIG